MTRSNFSDVLISDLVPFSIPGRSTVSCSSPSKRKAMMVHLSGPPRRGAEISEAPYPFGKRYTRCSLPPCIPRQDLQ